MNLCIDLCCGLKGFSQAFAMSSEWDVVTVDVEPRFQPTICADVLALKASDIEKAARLGDFTKYGKVVVLASPPCERFSIANSNWPQMGIRKALEIVGACLELIIDINPDYYLIENPKGRLRWVLGPPTHSIRLSDYGHRRATQGGKSRRPFKPTDLWGNVPFNLVAADVVPSVRVGAAYQKSSKRAQLPFALSQALLGAVEEVDNAEALRTVGRKED